MRWCRGSPMSPRCSSRLPTRFWLYGAATTCLIVMVATAHGPTVTSKPDVVRDFAAGLAGASHYTRNHRDESVEIFAQWVPNTDVAVGKKAIRHINYDPRLSLAVMRAF